MAKVVLTIAFSWSILFLFYMELAKCTSVTAPGRPFNTSDNW